MKLKCVGGPHDGEWRDIRDGERDVILSRNTSPPISINEPPENWPESVTIEKSHYTVRAIWEGRSGKPMQTVQFLSPVEWTDAQAIIHQFKK